MVNVSVLATSKKSRPRKKNQKVRIAAAMAQPGV
jgi:hypothetical protein